MSLALGMNTYTAFRVVPFILAAYLLYWLGRDLVRDRSNLRRDLGGMAILAGGAFTAILPLGVFIIQRWDVFTVRMRSINVFRDVEQVGSLQPIYDNLRKTLFMFNWRGDESGLNNLPGAPMLDTLAAALLVLGLAYSLWHLLRGRALPVLYVLWAVGIASLAVLSVAHEAPSARRTIGMLPLVYLLVALYGISCSGPRRFAQQNGALRPQCRRGGHGGVGWRGRGGQPISIARRPCPRSGRPSAPANLPSGASWPTSRLRPQCWSAPRMSTTRPSSS